MQSNRDGQVEKLGDVSSHRCGTDSTSARSGLSQSVETNVPSCWEGENVFN